MRRKIQSKLNQATLKARYLLAGRKLTGPFRANTKNGSEPNQRSSQNPSVSIIMTTFNSAENVKEAVCSALESKYVAVELLIVDDASLDETPAIIRDLASDDSRIRVFENSRNFGTYFCRNLGLLLARHDYVAFLDSDDLQHPERVRIQIDSLEASSGSQVSVCLLRRWDHTLTRPVSGLQLGYVTTVFRRSLIHRVGFFDSVRFGGDIEFIERVQSVFGARALLTVPKELYEARTRSKGLTMSGPGVMRRFNRRGTLAQVESQERNAYALKFRKRHKTKEERYVHFPMVGQSSTIGNPAKHLPPSLVSPFDGLGHRGGKLDYDFVFGVTTFNRLPYLCGLLDSFSRTAGREFSWLVIVADDGSTDGSQAFVKRWASASNVDVILIQNSKAGIAGQSNSILKAASQFNFGFGFRCDDDVLFSRTGWPSLYLEAAVASGVSHLVFHDPHYAPATVKQVRERVASRVDLRNSLGAFWTFTSEIIRSIGFFDEINFPVRGHSHWDFTARACRSGFNSAEMLWDAAGSEKYVRLRSRHGYIETLSFASPEVKSITTRAERLRRMNVVEDVSRRFIPWENHNRHQATFWSNRDYKISRLEGFENESSRLPFAFVLNLQRTPERWERVSNELQHTGLHFNRFEGVDGLSEPTISAWKAYEKEGLKSHRELELGRKLIERPGALGYLRSVNRLIRFAISNRLLAVITFDDDVFAHRQAATLIRNGFSQLPDRWKMLYLGYRPKRSSATSDFSADLQKVHEAPWGSFALALHHSTYDLLLAEVAKEVAPFDDQPIEKVLNVFPGEVFALKTPAFIPDVSTSLIRMPRDLRKMAQVNGWKLSDYPGAEKTLRESGADLV